MPIFSACPSCASRLRIPEEGVGQRIKCPKCNCIFAARDENAAPEPRTSEARVTAARPRRPTETPPPAPRRKPAPADEDDPRPASRRRRVPDDEDEVPAPRARRKARSSEDADEEPVVLEEADDEGDAPPRESPRKKKLRKKKRRRLVPDDDDRDPPTWPWWVFGTGGMALMMTACFLAAVFAKNEFVSGSGAYLLIALPIGTVIFFAALVMSNVLVGTVEIGLIHVAVVKTFVLVTVANLVGVLPFGRYLTLIVWFGGVLSLFSADAWEAMFLVFVNWVLNFLLNFMLFATMVSWMAHGGGAGGGGGGSGDRFDDGPLAREPGQHAVWDEGDIMDRGGTVEYDARNPMGGAVVVISLRDTPISDADLAHMKDFPSLIRLDLTGTAITDAGLAQLKSCKGLQTLFVTRTRVTAAGLKDLQKALPRLRIVT